MQVTAPGLYCRMVLADMGWHAVLRYALLGRWLQGKKTMLDSGVFLKQLERYCSSHCKQVLRAAETGLSRS